MDTRRDSTALRTPQAGKNNPGADMDDALFYDWHGGIQ